MVAVDGCGLALVVPSARREGGGDVWLEQLLRHLPALGPPPLVIFEMDGELAERAAGYGCRAEVLTSDRVNIGNLWRLVRPLAAVLNSARPDVTVFWSPRAQLYGAHAYRAAGRPGRTAWVQHVIPSDFWMHREAAARSTDLVLCVSGAVQRAQQRLYPRWPTAVVHPGIDGDAIGLRDSLTSRRRSTDGPVIGVVGRVEPWKGQDLAVRMLAELATAGVAARVVFIGERMSPTWPDFAGLVDHLVAEHGLGGRVSFTGHLRDIRAALAELDVLVCASREEGFGLAIVEATQAGVPVIATCCGGPEDIVEDGVSGLLVPAEDPAALAAAVRRVVDETDLADAFRQAASSRWRERFTAATSARTFYATVAALTTGAGSGARI
jgi:glycosyltransferase involved in cell wall biosynthesis